MRRHLPTLGGGTKEQAISDGELENNAKRSDIKCDAGGKCCAAPRAKGMAKRTT